ncbi:MAG: PilZ domain-containing protein [Candidatus Endonucleobacter bathymodioli]|uniref:PilZ domain-containing protein n=1 Tax=Candidatus Endonucleibacter bathymodioli TaxID=539814 RepID=A0AA90NN02_9GAMM|nr:PilZ domain-containing protein [Candidatus Endonucleobacter bathymodioli]
MDVAVQEKRRFPRKQVDQTSKVIDNDTDSLIGTLKNVSIGGFSVIAKQGIRLSEERHVTLHLSNSPMLKPCKVSLVARCVWCQSSSEKNKYAVGFVLCDIEELDAVTLNHFIRSHKV